jgi:hypothetical protein
MLAQLSNVEHYIYTYDLSYKRFVRLLHTENILGVDPIYIYIYIYAATQCYANKKLPRFWTKGK